MQNQQRYPKLIIALHWATLVLIAIGVALVLIRDAVEGKPLRLWLLNLHRTIGILIPLVALTRLALVLKLRKHLPVHPLSILNKLAARAMHYALYIALFAVPALGLALTNTKGQSIKFLGLIPIPALMQENSDWSDTLSDWHEWAAYGFIAFICMHAIAALWHHYITKDNVLTSISPFNKAISRN